MVNECFSLNCFNSILSTSASDSVATVNTVITDHTSLNTELSPIMDAIKANISPCLKKNVYVHFYKYKD